MNKMLILMLALILVAPVAAITASAWGGGHPDRCMPCHGAVNTVQDTQLIDNAGTNVSANYNFWDHNIQRGASVWDNCQICHDQLWNNIQASAHSGIGCKCHAVIHVGNGSSTNFFGAVFYWEASGVVDVIAPDAANLTQGQQTFDENSAPQVLGGSFLDPNSPYYVLGPNADGMEVEVGVWQPFTNKVIDVGTLGTVSGDALQVCFGCHFLAQDPSQVGAYAVVGGKWKIGIPESALSLPPHEIYPVPLEQSSFSAESAAPITAVIAGLAGIAMVVIGGRARGA